jgi:uncharacterized protein (DUF58 family)
MKWWHEVKSRWPGNLRQHVTRAGLVYSATILVVALAAFVSANNLLFLILAAMLSVLLISGFVSKLGLAGLEIDLTLPEHISARRKLRAAVRLNNLKWTPSFSIHVAGTPESGFDASIYFPVIPGRTMLEEPIDLFFPRRGLWRERSFQFTTRFPFGFAERREFVTTRHEIVVYPCLDAPPGFETLLASVSGDLEARQRGRSHDFYRIRPYEALESARHVDWRATAHTGSLQVREFVSEEDHHVVLYLDLDVTHAHERWFETAVDCAAFLAYRLSLRGARVRFRTQEFDVTLPGEGNIYTILKYLAVVSRKEGAKPEGPEDSSHFQIVLSPDLQRMSSLGWGTGENRGSRLLGLDAFSGGSGAL